jgi:NAD(P)-dependent dehydrogenase (short-subunit alcohol dehydrogenase family)
MRYFQSKVAVITGAASGIGRGLAEKCVREGMRVVLADIEKAPLQQVAEALSAQGARVLPVQVDVSQASEVEGLAEQAFSTFGGVHLLFNNAGVGAGTTVWNSSLTDWEWVLGVNLWGVIHGVHYFVPRMLAQNEECHIVNTASSEGVTLHSGLGVYRVSKFGVVALTETLAVELAERAAKIKVSMLCPEWVNTRIVDSDRNRPAALRNEEPLSPESAAAVAFLRQAAAQGMPPSEVAEAVFDAIQQEKFYIFTHPTTKFGAQVRADDILNERNPRDVLHLS